MANEQLFKTLGALLGNTKLDDITADSTDFPELPDGYFLCSVEKTELKENKKNKPMVTFTFTTVEDGLDVQLDDYGVPFRIVREKTENKKLWVHFVIDDESKIRRFVTAMLKFEGDELGVPLLEKECFTSPELLEEALEILVGCQIYVHRSTTLNRDGTESTWNNLVSWKRAAELELPV